MGSQKAVVLLDQMTGETVGSLGEHPGPVNAVGVTPDGKTLVACGGRAGQFGFVTVWDLAHSAGALPVDLAGSGADFAAGCTYKYLNAGPGAPAFLYVAPRHADSARAALSGWMGHAKPSAFDLGYAPAGGIERMRVGTPPVLAMAALEASLDIWDRIDIAEVRGRSLALGTAFVLQGKQRQDMGGSSFQF